MVIDTDKCWLYAGSITSGGYGQVFNGGKSYSAHRIMWEYANKQVIPESLTIDHLCRVRCCINPHHLEAVSMRENILRGNGAAAPFYKRTACSRGHEYNDVNTRLYHGHRRCRVCDRENWRPNKRVHIVL